jgi:hypothetical protein
VTIKNAENRKGRLGKEEHATEPKHSTGAEAEEVFDFHGRPIRFENVVDLLAELLPPMPSVRIRNASIVDSFNFSSGTFPYPLTSAFTFEECRFAEALVLEGADVPGLLLVGCRLPLLQANAIKARSVKLRDGFAGSVVFSDARLGPADDALLMESMEIEGDVECDALEAHGSVRLTDTRISGVLSFANAHLFHGLDLENVESDKLLLKEAAVNGVVNLDRTHVRVLIDSWGGWRSQYERSLRGFSYESLDPLDNLEERLKWIETARHAGLDSYDQLAQALRQQNREAEARVVAARRRRRALEENGRSSRIVDRVRAPEALRVPIRRHTIVEDLAALLPSLVVMTAITAVAYGEGYELPSIQDFSVAAGAPSMRDLVAWVGFASLLLIGAYAFLPLLRWLLGSVAISWLRSPGTILADTAERIDLRYGLDARFAWSRLYALLPRDERELIDDTERRMDAAVAATAGYLGAAAISALLAGIYFEQMRELLIAPAAVFLLALSTVRRARLAAEAHGRAVEAAVDLRRFRLLEALHLPLPSEAPRERELFEQVSESFMLAQPSRVPYVHPAQVQAGLADVRTQLEQIVSETFTEAFEGPPLINYAGFVSVALTKEQGAPVTLTDEHVPLTLGEPYELRVTIAPRPEPGVLSEQIAIVNGETADEVPFDVGAESDNLALRIRDTPLVVPADGRGRSVTFPLRVEEAWPAPVLWIRVSQRGHLVQVVELRLELRQ